MNEDRMNEIDPAASITEQASDWWITLNAGPATPADHQAFGEWAARSPERIEAFLETARLTKVLKSRNLRWPDTPEEVLARQAREAGADVLHLREPSPAFREPAKTHFRKPALRIAGGAASILGLIVIPWMLANRVQHYETAVGEQRSVALEDGSIVTLNTASRIEVNLDKDRRRIRLLAGEALFQVARDSARPFDVIARETTVRAVGTQFNVDRRSLSTVVTVVEGKVAVVSEAPSQDIQDPSAEPPALENTRKLPASIPSSSPRTTYLSAGEQLTIEAREASIPKVTAADLTVATAWTQRRLVFDHRSIGEVAEEFNRYNRLRIVIVSPELRAEEMTGVFQANDPESFLDFVSKMPGVKIERNAANTRVSTSRGD